MQKVEMLVGIPGSGKSTYAKQIVAKDPSGWVRVNNDDLRAMMNGSVWSSDYEKIITDARNYLVRDALKRGKSVIIDNLNINKRHFEDVCKIAKTVNVEVQVFEKAFYIELDEALARNAKREGTARVPDDVVKKWWKDSGGKQFKFYKPRVEIFTKRSTLDENHMTAIQNTDAPKAIICDLDGTLSLLNGRDPYNASTCDQDLPNTHVIEMVQMFFNNGFKIIFCSGREDKYEAPTKRFIETYLPGVEYKLFMRRSDDFRKDALVKEEIYENKIKDNYYVRAVMDDRLQVCQLWFKLGLPLFRVGDPDASF